MASFDLPTSAGQDSDDAPQTLALSRGRLVDVLEATLSDLSQLALPLDAESAAAARRQREALTIQISDHILPRLRNGDVPAIVVVGGSTGAGKSTLVNSVLGTEVSEAGVLRPTTRTPVLVVNPEDAQALEGHPVARDAEIVVSEAIAPGLTLVDASDLDSVQEANREHAQRLVESADLWMFVTTAARYGDLTPWTSLEEAAGRERPIAIVLNRAPVATLPEVRRDLVERLDSLGLAEAPFFVVTDAGPHEGLLPEGSVCELREWLQLLAGRHRAAGLMRRTDRSLWSSLRTDLGALAEAIDEQEEAGQALEEASQKVVADHVERLRFFIARGGAGEGVPTTRWLTLASHGGPLAPFVEERPLRRGFFGAQTRARRAGLESLVGDLRQALAFELSGAMAELHREGVALWTKAGVGEQAGCVLSAEQDLVRVMDAWEEGVLAIVTRAALDIPGLDDQQACDLTLAGAGGVEGAAEAARRLGYGTQLEAARALLADLIAEAMQTVIPVGAALSLIPDSAIAAALRLRSVELAPLVRPGGEK